MTDERKSPSRPSRTWLIHGILNHGDVLMIYGPSGVGKSLYAVNIAASLVVGRPVLGIWQSRASRVGLADYEMSLYDIRQRCTAVIRDGLEKFIMQSFFGRKLADPLHLQELEINIRDFSLDVLIMDPLAAAYNAAQESLPVIGTYTDKIRKLAHRTGCAIILVHHTGKPKCDEFGEKITLRPRGNQAISDAVNLELQVLPSGDVNRTTLLCTKARANSAIAEGWQRDFVYDPESLKITPMHPHVEDKAQLVDRLKTVSGKLGLSNRAVARKFSLSDKQVARWFGGINYPDDDRLSSFITTLEELELEVTRLESEQAQGKANPQE